MELRNRDMLGLFETCSTWVHFKDHKGDLSKVFVYHFFVCLFYSYFNLKNRITGNSDLSIIRCWLFSGNNVVLRMLIYYAVERGGRVLTCSLTNKRVLQATITHCRHVTPVASSTVWHSIGHDWIPRGSDPKPWTLLYASANKQTKLVDFFFAYAEGKG